MKNISVYFDGYPGDLNDAQCTAIFKKYGGDPIGAGTMLGNPPERDQQWFVPDDKAMVCINELKAAKFRFVEN